jgi:molybdenum cofactor synthesis domain-containing protein
MPDNNGHSYRAAVITLSDQGAQGSRSDESGEVVREIVLAAGFTVVQKLLLPDEPRQLAAVLKQIADEGTADLVLTTGGTGFSPRDTTPEATLAVAERNAPGIAEAMRAASMTITGRAMLSRGVSVIRKSTLIINLPGSPRAVRESLSPFIDDIKHGLAILTRRDGECARV